MTMPTAESMTRGRRCASCGFDYRAHLAVLPAHAFSVVNVKGEDMAHTLYARINPRVHDDLRAVAQLAGLSIAVTVETIPASVLGHDHRYRLQVQRAVAAHKRGERAT